MFEPKYFPFPIKPNDVDTNQRNKLDLLDCAGAKSFLISTICPCLKGPFSQDVSQIKYLLALVLYSRLHMAR